MVVRKRRNPAADVSHVLEFVESAWPGRCVGERYRAWDAEWRRIFDGAKVAARERRETGVALPLLRAHLDVRRSIERVHRPCGWCQVRGNEQPAAG